MKIHDDYADAMAYLKERVASEEYHKALMERHPLMNSAAANVAANVAGQQAMWNSTTATGRMTSQAWPQAPLEPRQFMHNTTSFTVEKVDNGFILRSGKYSKVCKDMDELKDLFVSIMVEQQLDK
jgi:hypothetical protein